jgi:hypothetical protein
MGGEMVKLLNELSQTVETFETDEAFYRYLESRADESWQFKIYPPEALSDLLKEMGEKSLVYMAYQACQQKRDMLVIGVGEEKNPFFFILKPKLNITTLRREWAKRYCAEHKLRILIN